MTLNEYQILSAFDRDSIYVMASDAEGHKCVLLKSKGENLVHRLKTDYMSLKTNVEMMDGEKRDMGKYHVVLCLSNDIDVNNQFVRVCSYMFSAINENIETSFIIQLFQDIQTLFETSADTDTHNLQVGVYGEMELIKYLRENGRDDLAEKWHSDFYTRHDIEIDSSHRIEIKTTNKEKRIHSFRHNQLVQKNMDITIASVKVEECEQGTNLYDLLLEVQNQFTDIKKKLLIEKLIKRCKLTSEDKGIICNEQIVFDDIKLYKANDVPHIDTVIPAGVTNVSYDVNFDATIPEVSIKDI